jgi:hypothetical protein
VSRVFNVSHHKCGTTSVHEALRILGFKSHHCEDPDRLLKVHLEGAVSSDPLLNEDNAAWGDLPITIMYRALYETFPDETYLFVRRDPASWLQSLRRHIMGFWPGPLPIHTLVYGYPITALNFDEEACLRAYLRIRGDILGFFMGKPNFHLIEFEELSWKPLCEAVGRPEPAVPFPWEKRSSAC